MLKLHKLYNVAFGALREKANALGVTLKKLAQVNEYKGKVLRRGTPGAFGHDLRPRQATREGLFGSVLREEFRNAKTPGNARQRRFARRHPQHFVQG